MSWKYGSQRHGLGCHRIGWLIPLLSPPSRRIHPAENTGSKDIDLSSNLLIQTHTSKHQGNKIHNSQATIPSIQQRVSISSGTRNATESTNIHFFDLHSPQWRQRELQQGCNMQNVPKRTHQFKILFGAQTPSFVILTFSGQTLPKVLPRPFFKV